MTAPAPSSARKGVPVFAVGGRAFVACEHERSTGVALTDGEGKGPLSSLGDGTHVGILAWRPGPGSTTRYLVRAIDSGDEGWLAVGNLRRTAAPVAPAVAAAPEASRGAPGPSASRFGRRS
jgi:hypothetical protein